MPFTPEMAAALSGATTGRLEYWRSSRSQEPLLRPATHRPGSTVFYSFQDVVALRTFVRLRSAGISLQDVRRAVQQLRDLGEDRHLSSYKLLPHGTSVVWWVDEDDATDLTKHPGHKVFARAIDISKPFTVERIGRVVDLQKPAKGISVDPEIKAGFPVIAGSRVPYDVIAGLARGGMTDKEIRSLYPPVTPRAVLGARELDTYVDKFRRDPVAA